MPCLRSHGARLLQFATAILAAFCSLTTLAVAQTITDELPQDCTAYTALPLPPEAEKALLPQTPPTCASYRTYRGLGRPVNYAEARACAWQERLAQKAQFGQNLKEPTAWVVGGSLILADIYFNGAGVKRNIPLAIRFACESEEGMTQLALPDIAKRKKSSHPHVPFEFCDYAATTFTQNFCSDYTSQIEHDRRGRYYNSLKFSMTPEQKTPFEKLLAAEKTYVQTHALEVDQGGSIHAIRTIGSENILEDRFHTEVVHFESKKWPSLSEREIATADARLKTQYAKTLQNLRTRPTGPTYQGAVTPESLSRVEISWEAYRDAWVAFARLRYPSAAAAIRAEITFDRRRLLGTIT